MVSSPTIQRFALAMVPVLVLMSASVTANGLDMTVRLHIAMTSNSMTNLSVLVMGRALKPMNVSVMMDGWDWIAPSLTALVSHPTSLIECAQARASVSDPTSATVMMDSEGISAKYL